MSSIVYIDDEPMICRVIASVLDGCGAEVSTFYEPVRAVKYINAHTPSLVICDYRMPGMDGLELLSSLQVDVPFVLISGYLDLDAVAMPGVTTVLSKPIRPEDLLKFVQQFI